MKRIVFVGLFAAFAVILSYIEAIIPVPFYIPGAKLGIANLAVLMVLYLYDWQTAVFTQIVRLLIIALLFGNLFSFAFSLAGAVVSLLAMVLLYKLRFHVIIVSAAGGIFHNVGQLIVAGLLVGWQTAFYYAPILLAAGVVSGVVIGIVARIINSRLKPVLS
jgi:heptaprenyl diphosphate synthase